ncbi:hypothetical protein GCM10022239_18040 [Leifsonia bigeumensis]|uniref:Uncharacterized protein n=1 Tax=Leifsonella bigeumensis TaxID=433643 RepID=A0ABP7FP51_9MICO
MPGAGVDGRLEVDTGIRHALSDVGEARHEPLVLVAVKGVDRPCDRGEFRGLRRRAVKGSRGADARIRRREREAVAAAEAETGDGDAPVDARLRLEVVDDRAQLTDRPRAVFRFA